MRSTLFVRMLIFALSVLGFDRIVCSQDLSTRDEFFEKRIRPALSEHCLSCHSNATEVNGGLVLDSAVGWEEGGDSGQAIERGDPKVSLLVKAIEYEDPHLQMPPDGKMPARVIEDFRKWIREGAFDPREEIQAVKPSTALPLGLAHEHWAYRPVARPDIPINRGATDIDRFIQAELDAKGITAAEKAPKGVLLRRLSLDLHGLPPTPKELTEFESDHSEHAYERLVDRLLTSPRYAERMARHWLDVVRFGESLTLRGFVLSNAWRYRDYCIQAFEEDRPWNQVIREQVAGDLMASDDLDTLRRQKIAVAFWLLGNSNLEEQDKQQLEMDIIDEQLDTFGKVFLGQTLGCARCHDHKFDPIPTHDYYALAGVMKASQVVTHSNVSNWIEEPLPSSPEEKEYFDGLDAQAEVLTAEIDRLRKEINRITKRETPIVTLEELPGVVVDDAQAKKIGVWKASRHTAAYVADGYIHDDNELKGSKTVSFEPKNLPPGSYEVRFAYASGPGRARRAKVTVYSADGDTLHEVDQTQTPPIDQLWISLGRYRFEKDGQAYVLVSNDATDGHVIADAVQFLSDEDLEASSKSKSTADSDTEKQSDAPEKAALQKQLTKAEAKKKQLDEKRLERPNVLAMLPVAGAEDLPIHIRGDVHNLGKVVPRGTLQLVRLPSTPNVIATPYDRVQLADWLTDPANPLTARVMVNRVWSWLMGEGLVRTTDNFGTTGEDPSHPELLDYLASRFIHDGWSVRRLIREIVLTEAYQRRSDTIASADALDPENRWLWRGCRRRLEAEVIRDSILFIAGTLDEKRFGSHLPKGLKSDYGFVSKTNVRSVYTPVLRNSIPDLFNVFDAADPSTVVGKRNRSTTASQALWMMNHPWVAEMAKDTAARILGETSNTKSEQLDFAAQLILGRELKYGERDALETLVRNEAAVVSLEEMTTVVHCMFQSIDFRFPE